MRYLTECAPIFALGLTGVLGVLGSKVGRFVPVVIIGALVIWNIGLIAAYGLQTVSRYSCVSFSDMLAGVQQVVTKGLAFLQ
jgi:hypothetical protein